MKFGFFILLGVFICCIGKPKLIDFSYSFTSGNGEDGIVRKIFEIIGTKSKICVEFGAADGFNMSNTALLWTICDWKGVLIEGNKVLFERLKANVRDFNCMPIFAIIGTGEDDSIEGVLRNNGINEQIDLLSIDVDGNDYYIFNSLKELHPRVIICEYNPSMPAMLDIYPKQYDELGKFGLGCSVYALIRIAEAKGYKLIALTEFNAFFVVKEEFDKFKEFETSLEGLRIDKHLKYVITDHNGNYAVTGERKDFYWSKLSEPLDKTRVLGNFCILENKFQK